MELFLTVSDPKPQRSPLSGRALRPVRMQNLADWGIDRAALLDEVTKWRTYYLAELSGKHIVDEMLAH